MDIKKFVIKNLPEIFMIGGTALLVIIAIAVIDSEEINNFGETRLMEATLEQIFVLIVLIKLIFTSFKN